MKFHCLQWDKNHVSIVLKLQLLSSQWQLRQRNVSIHCKKQTTENKKQVKNPGAELWNF